MPIIQIKPEHRKGYEEHAAPESIAAYLADARKDLAKLNSYIQWLENLLERRIEEKVSGKWPKRMEKVVAKDIPYVID